MGIGIQAFGWLLVGFRYFGGVLPDAIAIVVGNVAVVLGFAECVRSLRAFGGRPPLISPCLPVIAVLISSIVFTYIEPSRVWRMATNSAFLALLFAQICREVLRLGPAARTVRAATGSSPGRSRSAR